ncbi:MAG: hypothetical protein NZ821_08095 [Gloeomargarita sp. SKYB31]|nr:hypothetical protein [Gloeomargarita sp. SKYB31]
MWKQMGLLLWALWPQVVLASEPVELLTLKVQADSQVVRDIRFYGTAMDPNHSSLNDRFTLTIDGKTVPINAQLARRLQHLRRSFSYDSQSGGIDVREAGGPVCRMAGPARGMVLETRYLTYENNQIVHSDMRPVFSLAENCLFTTRISPRQATAREDARAVVEILLTLSQMRP